MRKGLKNCLVCMLCLMLSLVGIASAEGTAANTFEATTTGHNGDLTVSVTMNGDKIEVVEITAHRETTGVADAAIDSLPTDIVANQSVAVDTYTGATVTSRAILRAAAEAIEASGADLAKFQTPVSRRDLTTEEKELSVDLVVVGAGAAGMSTAVSAAQNGAESVIVLETQSTIGGNAMVSGGFLEYMGAPEELMPQANDGYNAQVESILAQDFSDNELMSSWQETVRQQYEEYKSSGSKTIFDSNELLAIQYHLLALGRPDDTLIGYAEKSHSVCEWFADMGVNFGQCVDIIGFPWPRWSTAVGYTGGNGFFTALTTAIEASNLPVEIMLETRAQELMTTDGKVTGVVAKNIDGTTYRINANNVVLATGGFGANKEMLVKYNTQWDHIENILNDNRIGNMGDGIVMAEAVGAGTAIMDQYMVFPLASPLDGHLARGINGNMTLYVNKEGKRFVDETAARNTISQAILNQTDGICYIIDDADNAAIVDGVATGGETLEFLKGLNAVYVADTIEELAVQIGIDPATLKETVDAYNQAAETYTDTEFGRTVFPENSVVDQGPFYACPRTPAVHILLGGLTCAGTGEVISTQGAPIPGLYAAGEVTAGGAALSSFADGMALGQYLYR